ncbi:serine hydrolase [Sphingomonas sp. Leaf357]|uniref:serine hydrolase domain-containing protein n=1 Tax=Sphingomonas sp. Leaf357 TaxID=1736350 RepID=UPI000700088F|nr:serine hydrolase domain-containing protein [Sphingomonas sp. Leaf357]KQS02980.1 serine hydrolase [Sphingomonas sp. Leaf357]
MLGLSAALAMIAPAAVAPSSGMQARIDAAAEAAMARTGAKGLAIAVVDRGRILAVRGYGRRNAAGAPLAGDTVMYGASLTKMIVGYTVMQMVAEGKVDLDRPIAEYLPRPLPEYGNLDAYGHWGDLAGDPRWRRITMRHVLTHSTGFANFAFVEPDGKLRIHFEPGSRYAYSGEGMMLLQFALEKGLGLDLGKEVQRRVFAPFGMTNTSLIWRADFARNLADGWKSDGSVEPHDERSRVRAAGSMDTTIADMARFAAAVSARRGLSKTAFARWVRPQLPITSRAQFPTLLPEAPAVERTPGLSAALGVVAFTGPQGPGFYKGGHDDSTGNTFVCLERARRCVVILSNDVRAEAAFPDLVKAALGDTGAPWRWEYPQLVAK